MKHYFLVAKDVGDLTRIVCAVLEEREAKNAPRLNRLFRGIRARRARAQGLERFRGRARPHQRRFGRCVRARSGQPDPHLSRGRTQRHPVPPRCAPPDQQVAAAHRQQAAARSRGEPAVPGDPLRPGRRRIGAPRHERGRRARPLHPRLRQDRRDDAVQHVPPLHGGRASHPRDRSAVGHPHRQAGRRASALRQAAAGDQGPDGADRRALPARHRQGAAGGPFDRRRQGGAKALSALRAERAIRPSSSPGWSSSTSPCRRSPSRATSPTAVPSWTLRRSCRRRSG